MAYDDATLSRIYDRTSGYCHLCGKKLSFTNYGRSGRKGAWHVEHSVPRAKGGTDHGNNLFAACIDCNLEKSDSSTRTSRNWNGRTRAPLSRGKRKEARTSNIVAGGTLGGLLGAALGPLGVAIGVGVGAKIGHDVRPD
jgi:5-methylcytosine-specific restriction endonuclease McrA